MHRQAPTFGGVVFVSLLLLSSSRMIGQATNGDTFLQLLREVSRSISPSAPVYEHPSDESLKDWSVIYSLYRERDLDSCRQLLAVYNYTLTQVKDAVTGRTYDVLRERFPISKGWGTFIRNPKATKRLMLQVVHPVEDEHVLELGAEMFRQLGGEWLMIAGTPRSSGKRLLDAGKLKRSVFQRWHEMVSSLTYISLSVHGFSEHAYPQPISTSDIVVSNGRTTDEQWGISQISLAFRDSMRTYGFSTGLAMYDSGYARLSGGWNVQGTFTNDSLGFGHWLYIELSAALRNDADRRTKFIAAADRALELTGKKISEQVNRAFGLVSPRVVRLDARQKMLFPSEEGETYRIISFNPRKLNNDTIDVRLGNWLNLGGPTISGKAVTTVDTFRAFSTQIGSRGKRKVTTTVVTPMPEVIGDRSPGEMNVSALGLVHQSVVDGESETFREPLQVHRIPLHVVLGTNRSDVTVPLGSAFRWEGPVPEWIRPNLLTFSREESRMLSDGSSAAPSYLIPLMHSRLTRAENQFVGIQMTRLLVSEIARIVSQNETRENNIQLLAEQAESGEYYLRIFPANDPRR